jgi:hypothetical protein
VRKQARLRLLEVSVKKPCLFFDEFWTQVEMLIKFIAEGSGKFHHYFKVCRVLCSTQQTA